MVVGMGAMEQKGFRDHACHAGTPGGPTHRAQVLVIDAHKALFGRGELAQEMGDGGLAVS